jgi:DNA-binding MarR family transcriptional regulator
MCVARNGHLQPRSAGSITGSAAFLLSKLGFESTRRFRAALAPLGLEPRQFALMGHVADAEGQTQQALGDALGIPKSRMVALIDDLESRGLVERRLRPEDRRARALHLTRNGCDLLAQAREVEAAHNAEMTGRLSPAEYRQLVTVLQKLAAEQGMASEIHPGLRE